jgi:hypothetical protein
LAFRDIRDGTTSSFFIRGLDGAPRPSSSIVHLHVRPSRTFPPVPRLTSTSLAPAVTTVTTLDKGLGILESAASDASAAFDVALVEGKQAEPLFHAPSSPATATTVAGAATTAATATAPDAALSARFTRLAKDVAIVLMHEEEDVSSKAYMIEAIKVGVVDVVRFPLVKQSMRTLWQHAVRKMIRAQAETSAKRSGAAAKRGSSRNGGLRLDQDNSGDSSASEERALKRQTAGSPASVLDEEEKAGVAESGGSTKRVAAGAKGAAGAEGSGKKSGGAAKPKPQARSTQQWKAAEQRGRRLAIKPHTAMPQGAQAGGPGSQMGRMGYYHPQQGQMMGQTQTMTINGQQVQVWVPMQHGMYAHPQQQQQNNPGQGGAPQNTAQPNANGAAQPPTNGPNGASPSGGKTGSAGGGGAGAQQQQPQPQHGYYGGGGMMQMQGGYHQPPPGMMLVQQPNGQQMWVQQAPVHGGWGQQQWGKASGGDGDGDGAGVGGGFAGASPTASTGVPGFDAVDGIKGQPLPLGLNLKRSNSLQNMVETSGLLDAKFDNPMDANMFRDVEFMEEDALDAILAQSRDGNLLSFDGMDEAMLEAAAGGGNGLEGMVRG